jgi:recombination protein RecA
MRPEALAFSDELNKRLKRNVIVRASDIVVPPSFTTGSLALDVALGGGWRPNQWTEILGKEQSGKTATIYKTIAANQRLDPDFSSFWLAAEHYDFDQAAALGVDNSRVEVASVRQMELALDMILDATESQAFECVVCDSFPALLPKEEAEKAMIEASMMVGARKFNQFWRKMGDAGGRDPLGSDRPFFGLMVNQWRDKTGWSPTGRTPQTSPGGHGKDFSYYTRVDISRDEWITESQYDPYLEKSAKQPVGQVMKIKTIKNKATAPQRVARIRFFFADAPEHGFRRGDYDLGSEYVPLGILSGLIDKQGGWFHYDGQKWNGRPKLEEAFLAEPELAAKLASQVLEIAKDPGRANSVLPGQVKAAESSGLKRVTRRTK